MAAIYHKFYFISARSTVFNAMFEHGSLESQENRVVIEDFDFETMKELVRFIYCERVENLKDVSLSLLEAADKVS